MPTSITRAHLTQASSLPSLTSRTRQFKYFKGQITQDLMLLTYFLLVWSLPGKGDISQLCKGSSIWGTIRFAPIFSVCIGNHWPSRQPSIRISSFCWFSLSRIWQELWKWKGILSGHHISCWYQISIKTQTKLHKV